MAQRMRGAYRSVSLIYPALLSGCALVEIQQGNHVMRGVQFGILGPSIEGNASPTSVKRLVAGLSVNVEGVSLGLTRESAWIVPAGNSCLLRGAVGASLERD